MKTKLFTMMAILTFLLFSCGQSAKEKLKTQQLLQDAISYATKEKLSLENQLTTIKADLEVAYDQMERIKEFQFGRTQNERDTQIKNQSIRIERLKKNIDITENAITQVQAKIIKLELDLKNIE